MTYKYKQKLRPKPCTTCKKLIVFKYENGMVYPENYSDEQRHLCNYRPPDRSINAAVRAI